MIKKLFIFFLFYMLNLFSNPCFAQEKTLKQKQISVLAKEANELFKAGEQEKSLLKIRFVLRQAIAINDDYLIACCYKIIASNVDELNQFEKALFYYKKSLVYANKTTNDTIKNKLNNLLSFVSKYKPTYISFDRVKVISDDELGPRTIIILFFASACASFVNG